MATDNRQPLLCKNNFCEGTPKSRIVSILGVSFLEDELGERACVCWLVVSEITRWPRDPKSQS